MHDDNEYIPPVDESLEDMMQRLTGIDIKKCPKCGKGRMARIFELLPEHIDYILPVISDCYNSQEKNICR